MAFQHFLNYNLDHIYFHKILDLYNLSITETTAMKGGSQHHANNLRRFGVLLGITQIVIIILYGVFVRLDKPANISATLNLQYYPAYQDVNVMMLIGFGFFMAFSKSFSWSAITYTFFINAILIQLYLLLTSFWRRVILDGFNNTNYYIYISQNAFTMALYSSASMFVAIGAFIGRVGPFECLVLSLVHIFGYTLNEIVCIQKIQSFDAGGTMTIFAFGSFSGITTSLILGSVVKPNSKPGTSYYSNLLTIIGTLFLWMFWPSFNFATYSTTAWTKTQVIINTILSLAGSCIATFATSAVLKEKLTMQHIQRATLAGGVVIGACSGIVFHPSAALCIGFLVGIVSTLAQQYFGPYLQNKIGLYDTCGILSVYAIPSLIGGILSGVIAASFNYGTATDAYTITATDFPHYSTLISTPFRQGGLQIAGTFTSIGIGIATALVGGFFLRFIYSFDEKELYNDGVYFQNAGQGTEETRGLKVNEHSLNELN